MTVNTEDILGVYQDGKLYCMECATEEMVDNATYDELLLRDAVERVYPDERYYCTECNENIN